MDICVFVRTSDDKKFQQIVNFIVEAPTYCGARVSFFRCPEEQSFSSFFKMGIKNETKAACKIFIDENVADLNCPNFVDQGLLWLYLFPEVGILGARGVTFESTGNIPMVLDDRTINLREAICLESALIIVRGNISFDWDSCGDDWMYRFCEGIRASGFLAAVPQQPIPWAVIHEGNEQTWNYSYDTSYPGRDFSKRFYFVFSHGIGDVVWSCSFMKDFLKQTEIMKDFEPVICCMKRDVNLIRSYFPRVRLTVMDKAVLHFCGLVSARLKVPQIFSCTYPRLKPAGELFAEVGQYAALGIEMDILYKYGCFNLSEGNAFTAPNMTRYDGEAERFMHGNHIPFGKSIVLIPTANSRIPLDDSGWYRLASILKEIGFAVYTNVGNINEKCIEGTEPLAAPLELMPSLVRKMGCAVSTRCGLADWLFVNQCALFIIHVFSNVKEDQYSMMQSDFARKESFKIMEYRCGISCDTLHEYRLEQEDASEEEIMKIAADITEYLVDKLR